MYMGNPGQGTRRNGPEKRLYVNRVISGHRSYWGVNVDFAAGDEHGQKEGSKGIVHVQSQADYPWFDHVCELQ